MRRGHGFGLRRRNFFSYRANFNGSNKSSYKVQEEITPEQANKALVVLGLMIVILGIIFYTFSDLKPREFNANVGITMISSFIAWVFVVIKIFK